MLKSKKHVLLLAILTAFLCNPAFAKDKPAAVVNGVSVPQSRVDLRVKIATSQGQPDTQELRDAIREDMIKLELLVQAAKKMSLNKDPDVTEQVKLAEYSILAGAYAADYAKKHPISESQLKQEYDRLKGSLGNNEYEARHILVATEAEAKDVISQIAKGGDFEKIAKEKSKDVGSAERGGSLGWAVPANFVPPFAEALTNLKKGEYTNNPVQTQFGWHVIKLEDVRNLKMPSYDEMKPQMQQRLQQQQIQSMVEDLRSKAKIK